jgi:putative sigma-54 modulation protein
MNYIISGKNIDVTEGLREAVYDKLGRLEKYFNEDTKVQVTFSVEKDRQKIEVTIPMKGHIIRAEQVSDDMYVSIDMVVEIIERQVTRYKKKLVDQKQDVQYFKSDFLEEEDAADDEVKIYRSKRFAVKPMYPEDACVQMELLGHNFYVFRNAETDEVNVVYKRKGNTYGQTLTVRFSLTMLQIL